ncbi:trypsin 3A1-like [Anopheles bellator]|uniref:trypsin 3A1-like n=1 Tax=Anopheles bellator TaxID=139047 RepID=UPI0026498D02|nr:trypsin 3A1-like [Anopheles bellator]
MKFWLIVLTWCIVGVASDEAQDVWESRQKRVQVPDGKGPSRVSGRIVGGVVADIGDFQFQLSLRERRFHICGASVISETWSLTAAHCQSPPSPAKDLTLLGGTNIRSDDASGVVFQVDLVVPNPKFNPNTFANDICVLRINGSFLNHPNVAPIPLAATGMKVPVGSIVTVSGWGLTASNETLAPTLRSVRVPTVSFAYCKAAWAPIYVATTYCHSFSLFSRAICAGQKGRDSCNGDSGGPLTLNGTQVGLVSWGDEECD